jgi:hypothetical protein
MGLGRNFVACRNLGRPFKTNRNQICRQYPFYSSFSRYSWYIGELLVMHLPFFSMHSDTYTKAPKPRKSLYGEYIA